MHRMARTQIPKNGMPHRRFWSSFSSKVTSIGLSPVRRNGGYRPAIRRT
jgi:hypothetical protein